MIFMLTFLLHCKIKPRANKTRRAKTLQAESHVIWRPHILEYLLFYGVCTAKGSEIYSATKSCSMTHVHL